MESHIKKLKIVYNIEGIIYFINAFFFSLISITYINTKFTMRYININDELDDTYMSNTISMALGALIFGIEFQELIAHIKKG